MFANPFNDEELGNRLASIRGKMAGRDLEIALFSTPENIFYLTGLDHWGYFAPHLLVVPADGEMVLITRQMERVSIEKQVRNALFRGHDDSETVADLAVRTLRDSFGAKERSKAVLAEVIDAVDGRSPGLRRIGVETWSAGHSYGFGHALRQSIDDAEWVDITGMADDLRLVKSPAEQALMRRAAEVSDAAAAAAMEAIHDGASERDVVAECHAAMIRAGLRAVYPARLAPRRGARDLGRRYISRRRTRLSGTVRLRVPLSRSVGTARSRRYDPRRGRADGRNGKKRLRRRARGAEAGYKGT